MLTDSELKPEAKLEAVRKKIVEANPEIMRKGTNFCTCSVLTGSFKGRPIRLADVLLAVMKAGQYFTFNHNFQLIVAKEYAKLYGMTEWECEHDSLDDQSEETIAFLHSLLC